ncbi:DUF3263 domain-containing protein [Rhodococcus sp. IEGM 1381]|uniref:DUF3263 domain-containing protein n=1 Tax=Rhodococcus sp. IEGM 1381 TaxID=3047085 RepID=UPI0024B6A58B|nr:DUF3263 domain-containing protein [Rhodococcus sp. IEGM 1381]MDI9893162.1 DUF3263 domain-containing protein [Rhodococcus sp. IEGM 1381]
MDKRDQNDTIERFARRWVDFGGGPDEEIFVTFGITPVTYFERLSTLLGKEPERFEERLFEQLQQLCRYRLANRHSRTQTLM